MRAVRAVRAIIAQQHNSIYENYTKLAENLAKKMR